MIGRPSLSKIVAEAQALIHACRQPPQISLGRVDRRGHAGLSSMVRQRRPTSDEMEAALAKFTGALAAHGRPHSDNGVSHQHGWREFLPESLCDNG